MFKLYLPYYNENENYEEFNIIVEKNEQLPKKAGQPLKHQKLITELMKGVTNIDCLLLVHDLGTGKTCTAINSIEKNLLDSSYGMSRAIILNRGKAIQNNFIYELVNKCTTRFKVGTETSGQQKKLWSKYYTFDTFEIFAKKINKMSDEQIINKYNNTFFVIDEVHHILNEESVIYQEISRFISLLPNKKVLLLSGTPVRDVPEDFVPIINLILDRKIDQKTFKDRYYDRNDNLTPEFKKIIMNKVSYLASSDPEITVKYYGKKILDLKKFIVASHIMSKFQSKYYMEAFEKDAKSGGIYNNSRQAVRFVFPDGTYGTEGYNNFINDKKYTFKAKMIRELQKYGTDTESVLRRIYEMSSKYAFIIESILEADKNGEKTIVYDDLVKGSGLIVFSMLLSFVGFKKHRLISAETTTVSEISNIQSKFNSSVNGEFISVIIGSKVISEGFTFLDVIHEHIVPHWNNTETMQVVARGIRMGSHQKTLQIKPNAVVTVYRNVSLPLNNFEKSIDYIMTKTSETKDIEINKIIEAVREVSITCNEFIKRNGGNCYKKKPVFFDKNNIISVGFYEEEKLSQIIEIFKTRNIVHINQIKSVVKNMQTIEIVKYLEYIINNKIYFINNIGIKNYITEYRNYYYIIDEILPCGNYIDLSYYCQDVKPYIQINDNILFNDTVNIVSNITTSNKNIQRLIELAVTVKMLNLNTTSPDTVDNILDKYKNSYFIDKNRNLSMVWFLSEIIEEKAKPTCLNNPNTNKPWKEWTKCNKSLKNELNNQRFRDMYEFENRVLNEKKQEYYGLWNPDINEFCIKHATENSVLFDKRKISSGKRCVNWDKNELLDIGASLNMDVDWNSWAENSRNYICDDIKNWMEDKDLIIESKYCGIQRKKK